MKSLIVLSVSICLIGPLFAASIFERINFENLADMQSELKVISGTGLPSHHRGGWYSYGGAVKIASGPGEEIFTIRLEITKDPLPRPILGELGLPYLVDYSSDSYIGERSNGFIETNGLPYPDTVEYWELSWYAPTGIQGHQEVYSEILLSATSEVWIDSSLGSYILESHNFTYIGVIPEPSTTCSLLVFVCLLVFTRKRPICR